MPGEGKTTRRSCACVRAVEPLAENVSGVGLDVPAWVRRLEERSRCAKSRDGSDSGDHYEPVRLAPGLDFEELRRQLADWDRPLGD